MHIFMGEVSLWGIEFRVRGAWCRWGARRVSNAVDERRIVRKHDCALPAQYTKHSNACRDLIRVKVMIRVRVVVRVAVMITGTVIVRVGVRYAVVRVSISARWPDLQEVESRPTHRTCHRWRGPSGGSQTRSASLGARCLGAPASLGLGVGWSQGSTLTSQ